jgi:hypothetical protein
MTYGSSLLIEIIFAVNDDGQYWNWSNSDSGFSVWKSTKLLLCNHPKEPTPECDVGPVSVLLNEQIIRSPPIPDGHLCLLKTPKAREILEFLRHSEF